MTAPRSPTLLVADDEPQLLRLVVRLLEREGWSVVAARDGREALEVVNAHRDDLGAAVLDAALAPEGARCVVERAHTARPGLGVVLMSGDQLSPSLAVSLRSWGGHFLRKPFLPAALIAAVRSVLSGEPV